MKRWSRPHYTQAARRARFEFFALLDGPRIDAATERAREASDPAGWESLELTLRSRATDGGRLDALLAGRPRFGLEAMAAPLQGEVARCTRYATIEAELDDPPSLDALQAALALLTALADEGDLLLALDGVTARWWPPSELVALPRDRPFELDEHVQIVVESVERRPGVGHLVRSRGLAKCARPDVAARAPRRQAERLSEILRDVARLLAAGEPLRAGAALRVLDLPPVTFVPVSDDALSPAPEESAPLYELRDLDEAGGPGTTCERLIARLAPRLKMVR